MCPIWPLHLIVIYLLALCPLWVVCQAVPELLATFSPNVTEVHMDDSYYVDVEVQGMDFSEYWLKSPIIFYSFLTSPFKGELRKKRKN